MNYILIFIGLILFSILAFKGISRSLLAINTCFFINNKSNVATIIIDNNLLYVKGPMKKNEPGELFFIYREIFPNYRYALTDFELESISDGVIKIIIWENEIIYNKFDDFIINGKHYTMPRAEFLSNSQPFVEISNSGVVRIIY